ncbi:hypothetical protein QTO34_000889 [Cnephaeus nilssonii]|uniref:SAM domain-containing protein n=1 Tax=Cnephaeus nilssonii TaxID=3371016 RepID=A0AA40LXD6_CNENI|nr:hypothetical protein QTO34_000889 [Eptesicus nilssonii]
MSLPASFSYTESYSPTTPVKRPRNDSQSNIVGTYYPSQDSLIHDNEDQEMRLSQSPTFPPYTQEDSIHYISDERMERSPFIASFDNQGHSSTCVFSAAQASTSVPAAVLEQGKSSVAYNSEMMAYPTLLEKNSLGRNFSSSCIAPAVSSVGTAPYALKQDFPDDPATWTVEEVILFLQHIDRETFIPIADTFRQHDIDGIALLLLQSEVMIKYMGIKLGTALKLCHYIEKLKTEKGIKV